MERGKREREKPFLRQEQSLPGSEPLLSAVFFFKKKNCTEQEGGNRIVIFSPTSLNSIWISKCVWRVCVCVPKVVTGYKKCIVSRSEPSRSPRKREQLWKIKY